MNNIKETKEPSNYRNELFSSIKKDVIKELIDFEYDFANIGTIFIIDVIEFICKSDDYIEMLMNLEKNVYIPIAKKYNMNLKTFKSDIAKATNKMHETRYLKYPNEEKSKKTAKTIINCIVNKIKCSKLSNQTINT